MVDGQWAVECFADDADDVEQRIADTECQVQRFVQEDAVYHGRGQCLGDRADKGEIPALFAVPVDRQTFTFERRDDKCGDYWRIGRGNVL